MSQEEKNDPLNNSVAKAITILNCFSYDRPRLRLKDIASLTGINQATAYRMLHTLKTFNLIDQHEGAYCLGNGFLSYNGIVLQSMYVRQVALPFMEDFSNILNVGINLTIRDGLEIVYVGRSEASRSSYAYFHVGMRRPLYCTASGKVLICYQPELANDIYSRPVPRYTLNTITDKEAFVRELETTKLRGYGVDKEEFSNGLNCIATPLMDATGEIIATISVVAPTSTHSWDKLTETIPYLMDYSHRISARLGGCL